MIVLVMLTQRPLQQLTTGSAASDISALRTGQLEPVTDAVARNSVVA
jgi:hypothetical protein